MTAELREAIRRAIDAHARATLPAPAEPCAGCGVESFAAWTGEPRYVDGCPTCRDRRIGRRARSRSAQLTIEGVAA